MGKWKHCSFGISRLIMVDVEDKDRSLALRSKMLLDRSEGMAALGFFSVRRSILLAVLGNVLTYLIILVEFKMDQL